MTTLEDAVAALEGARRTTTRLTEAADAELTAQHSPLMSPLVWDLAHVGQQEELWLLQHGPGRAPDRTPVFHPTIACLYDAAEHPRAARTQLPLLDPRASRRAIADVRRQVLDRLAGPGGGAPGAVFAAAMVAQHEHQHDETMFATHDLRAGDPLLAAEPTPPGRLVPAEPVLVPAGEFLLGVDPAEEPWALDNEHPQHRVHVPAFRIGRVPVTNGEWAQFVADGGYDDPRHWSAEGWAHRTAEDVRVPLGWSADGAGGWTRRSFGVEAAVDPAEPVQHVDFHEAAAYARWAGARLPTEVEWEKAAAWDPVLGRRRRWPWGSDAPTARHANLGGRALGPAQVGAYPAGASAYGVEQLMGDVWEWTSSEFAPWPGFSPMLYDTYSAPWFGGGYRVLRGGSWASDAVAVRPSFRNWDWPVRRQIFTGLRLAWDV
ncbi:ergothioneine biosynthesis protein EgtB [Kineococcus rhizosphaerae]|uniref:Iron(II)-dependent oxidoreductase n=1 Tax=Kineococcus rhizosphaerae TaxID=559628 RepID=A0A2T0R7F1_9ACTN|nr:ergothioneine biosynthesis protein EgtB [Kineococcus rhizosphaerae]PRY17082.1 iron(II)-dependent oxidoreductase [Kineococcus rhizosphaerae]